MVSASNSIVIGRHIISPEDEETARSLISAQKSLTDILSHDRLKKKGRAHTYPLISLDLPGDTHSHSSHARTEEMVGDEDDEELAVKLQLEYLNEALVEMENLNYARNLDPGSAEVERETASGGVKRRAGLAWALKTALPSSSSSSGLRGMGGVNDDDDEVLVDVKMGLSATTLKDTTNRNDDPDFNDWLTSTPDHTSSESRRANLLYGINIGQPGPSTLRDQDDIFDEPAMKPPAVQNYQIQSSSGSRIDTSTFQTSNALDEVIWANEKSLRVTSNNSSSRSPTADHPSPSPSTSPFSGTLNLLDTSNIWGWGFRDTYSSTAGAAAVSTPALFEAVLRRSEEPVRSSSEPVLFEAVSRRTEDPSSPVPWTSLSASTSTSSNSSQTHHPKNPFQRSAGVSPSPSLGERSRTSQGFVLIPTPPRTDSPAPIPSPVRSPSPYFAVEPLPSPSPSPSPPASLPPPLPPHRLNQTTISTTPSPPSPITDPILLHPPVNGFPTIICHVCNDLVVGEPTLSLPCGHSHCIDCIQDNVSNALKDESLFPPRCCGVPLDADPPLGDGGALGERGDGGRGKGREGEGKEELRKFLTMKLERELEVKRVEYSIPAPFRVYCPIPSCSTLVGSSQGVSTSSTSSTSSSLVASLFSNPSSSFAAPSSATSASNPPTLPCPTCSTPICLSCKQLSHPYESCSTSTHSLALKLLADEKKWMMCPGCKTYVETTGGCNHMVCRCTLEFCYFCGLKWKTCTC